MGLIARDVCLSLSLFWSLVSLQLSTFHPFILSATPPPPLSLCHFNLHSLSVCACQSFPSSLLLLSSCLCFSAEVSVDSSHIFPQPFTLLLLSFSLPHIVIPCFVAWSKSDKPKQWFSKGHTTFPSFLTTELSIWCNHYQSPISGQSGMTHFTHTTQLNSCKYVWAAWQSIPWDNNLSTSYMERNEWDVFPWFLYQKYKIPWITHLVILPYNMSICQLNF